MAEGDQFHGGWRLTVQLSILKTHISDLKPRIAGLGMVTLVVLPRVLTLDRFITSDEPLWIVRSIAFLQGLLTGDLGATLQTGHPGVTTMWTGSLGLILDYLLNHRDVGSLLAYVQSLPTDPMRVDASLVPWVRLPTALLSALCVWAVYRLARPMGQQVALVGSLLLGLDPFFLAHSRVLHHDALVSIFISLCILAWLRGVYHPARWGVGVEASPADGPGRAAAKQDWGLTIFSGVAAGLAFLSKSTSYILIPFVMVILLVKLVRRRLPASAAIQMGLAWLLTAGITFVVLWPAVWVQPRAVFSTVFGWIDQSASLESASESVDLELGGSVPDLGILFYLVNWLIRTTPLSLIGLLAFPWWWRRTRQDSAMAGMRRPVAWLVVWSLLLTLTLSLGDKRDARYLLPIYFALCLLAALGLLEISGRMRVSGLRFYLGLAVLLIGFSLPYHPYYLAYYNPLLGGPWIAPRLTKVGWGEGMEQAAAFLNQRPGADQLVVATSYAQDFLPYFAGKAVKHHQGEPSDYVLNYVRQVQNGYPYPEYWQYYRAREPIYRLELAGIDYVWLYQGSSLSPVRNAQFRGGLELVGHILDSRLVQPGTAAEVTLVWRAAQAAPSGAMAHVQLIDDEELVWGEALPGPVLDPAGPALVEGHYQMNVSPDAPRFDGNLRVLVTDANGQSLGQAVFGRVPVRRTSLPEAAVVLPAVDLDGQIWLLGYQVSATTLTSGQEMDVTLYWQAQTRVSFDYTVFVQLLTQDGKIWGQHDSQPAMGQLPASQWTVGEVVSDPHHFTVAPDAPPGDYILLVGMYRWDTGQRLPVAGDETGQNAVILGTIGVQPSK
jgi:hypothetical protein